MKTSKRVFTALLSLIMLAALILPMVPTASAASQVYYNIDFSSTAKKCGIVSKNDKDCALVSVASAEAYMYRASSSADKTALYNAVTSNQGSTLEVTSWANLGYRMDSSFTLQEVYDQLAKGYPVVVHRTAYGKQSQHWGVVCGYVGSTSKLEKSGFIVLEIEDLSLDRLDTWQGKATLDRYAWRRNGMKLTNLSGGIHMAVNTPRVIHPTGDSHGVYGYITSSSNLTSVIVRVTNLTTGKFALNKSFAPNAKSFSMFDKLDSLMTFAKWPAGEYYYVIYAKDAAGNTATYMKYFKIAGSWPSTEPSISYTLTYDTGTHFASANPSSQTIKLNGAFSMPQADAITYSSDSYASTHTFLGWNAERSDGKWYTDKYGWQTLDAINANGYALRLYQEGNSSGYMNYWWLGDTTSKVNLTFHAVWDESDTGSSGGFADNISGSVSDMLDQVQSWLDTVLPSAPEFGWFEADGNMFYMVEGDFAKGWQTIDGETYYFDENGIMQTGLTTIEGANYYFGTDGKMQTGLCAVGEGVRYFGADGKQAYGWIKVTTELYDEWYYFAAEDEYPTALTLPATLTTATDVTKSSVVNLSNVEFDTLTLDIPLSDPTWGSVVSIVNNDVTSYETIPSTIHTDTGVRVTVSVPCRLAVSDNSMTFPDISDDFWAGEGIDYVTSRGIMNGKGSGNFVPTETIARKTVAMILWRIMGSPEVAADTQMTDVNLNDIYTMAICWAEDVGVITGYSDGTFRGDGTLTRQHFAVMLYRFANYVELELTPENSKALTEFNDYSDIYGWAQEAVQWAVNNSFITGRSNGGFDPQGNASRAQLAVIMSRFLQKYYA